MSIISITDATFKEEIKQGISIVDFYADWCGPCKAVSPILERLAKEFAGKVKILKLNIDENQEIASEFGIRSIPTFISFKDGIKTETKVGGMSDAQFKAWFNSLL